MKTFRPTIILHGGRSGEDVPNLKGPPDSYIKGGGDRVFETDGQGRVVREITPKRVKIRKQFKNAKNEVFEKMEKASVTAADVAILKKMGVLSE